MAIVTTDNQYYTDIAAAIRTKSGTQEQYKPAQMAAAIESIPRGDDTVLNQVVEGSAVSLSLNAGYVGRYKFYQSQNLIEVNFPKATIVMNNAFSLCTKLVKVNFPAVTTIWDSVFSSCPALKTLVLPSIKEFKQLALYNCGVDTLVLPSNTVCIAQNANTCTNTPIASGTGYIYVPAALVEEYKAATNWTVYAGQFRAIEDYPDIAGGAV